MRLITVFGVIVCVIISKAAAKNITPLSNPEGRIIGGENVTIEDFPYQISLLASGMPWCGGTIISENVILTAAHCTVVYSPRNYAVLAGSVYSYYEGVTHRVSEVLVHENFDSSTLDFDVSLLILETPLQFSSKIQPIRLPNADEYLKENETVTISGWGSIGENAPASTVLQAVEIPVVNQTKCEKLYSEYHKQERVTSRMLCAGYLEGGKDHCYGDSGGPVVSNGTVHGIVSWAKGCARPNYPGVNTRVTAVREWIRSKVLL